MNRQALAFLTMFSLILMLSVYYVTLPSDTTSVMSTENGEELQEENKEEQVNDAEKLQQEITSKKEAEIKKNSDIVSSKDASETEKQEALTTMDELKDDQAYSEEIRTALQNAGFQNCAVEISEGTCRINIFDSEDNEDNAKLAMKTANEIVNDKYLLEVTFK